MNTSSIKRLGALAAGAVVGIAALTLPSPGLSLGLLSGSSLLHISDCRSVALSRQASYDIAFSSTTTGPRTIKVAALADGSLTLCYSLDVTSLTSVSVAVDAALSSLTGIINQTDASRLCTAINLTVAPGVKGTVTATVHGTATVDGAPPASVDQTLGKDVTINTLGEDISLKACLDTSGNASVS